ncbi:YbjN domain-containing protein [Orbaceae bacterium ac157xtp]
MQVVNPLNRIQNWLLQLNVDSYFCDHCNAIHLPHLQDRNNIHHTKIEVIDDALALTITSNITPQAILMLVSELCQINKSTTFVKVFMDVEADSDLAQIKFVHSLFYSDDLTFEQFSLVFTRFEEESLELIEELANCDMIADSKLKMINNGSNHRTTYH